MDDDTHLLLERLKSAVEKTKSLLTESNELRQQGRNAMEHLRLSRQQRSETEDRLFDRFIPSRRARGRPPKSDWTQPENGS